MRLSRLSWQLRVCALGASLCIAQGAASQAAPAAEPSSTEYDAYVAQALSAYEAGRFAEARSLFRRAHELAPTARTLRTIGMCSFNLGDYLDALQNLEAAQTDPRKPLSPQQNSQVSDLVSQSWAHVGRFRVRLSPADATLSVDGRPPQRLASGEVLLEPGRHELLAQATDHQPAQSTVEVDGGDRTTLEIRLEPNAAPPLALHPTASAPDSDARSRQRAPGNNHVQPVLGYVASGLGIAGLVSFAVTTGLAMGKKSSLEDHCPADACPPAYHDDVDSYDRLKLVSTVSLIAGASFGALGAILLLTQGHHDVPAERARLEPMFGAGSVGLRGTL